MVNILLLYVYTFLLGLIFGSFYNVVGLRIPLKQSVYKPRSACPHCNQFLTPLELVPVFSYLLQRGSCKKCKQKISPLYITTELLTALLFTISPMILGWSTEIILSFTFISLLMIILVSDISYMIIPDKVLLFFTALFLVEIVILHQSMIEPLLGSSFGFILLYTIGFLSRGGIGGGDIKLYAVIGMVLGWKLVLVSFFIATIFGSIVGFIGILIGKVKRGKPFPFGPAIVIGSLIAYFWGDNLISWYITNLFF